MIHTKTLHLLTDVEARVDPPPRARPGWQGVSHLELMTEFHEALKANNWLIQSQTLYLTDDKVSMAYSVHLQQLKEGAYPTLGLLNGNDWRTGIKLYSGLWFDCGPDSFGMCLNEYHLGKHQKRDDWRVNLTEALFKHKLEVEVYPAYVNMLRETTITQVRYEKLLVQLARKKIVPWARLGLLDHEYEGVEPSLLNLYACASKIIQISPPLRQMGLLLKLYRFLCDVS